MAQLRDLIEHPSHAIGRHVDVLIDEVRSLPRYTARKGLPHG